MVLRTLLFTLIVVTLLAAPAVTADDSRHATEDYDLPDVLQWEVHALLWGLDDIPCGMAPCFALQEGDSTVRFTIQDNGPSDKPISGLVVFKDAHDNPVGDRLHFCKETDTISIPQEADIAVVAPAGPLMTIFPPHCGHQGDSMPATTGTVHAHINPSTG